MLRRLFGRGNKWASAARLCAAAGGVTVAAWSANSYSNKVGQQSFLQTARCSSSQNTEYQDDDFEFRHGQSYVLVAGTGNPHLAQEVADYKGVELVDANIRAFADGEITVQYNESVRGKDVYIIQPMCPPVSDNVMELCLAISAARRASARRIIAVVPYYAYSTQDRARNNQSSIGAADVANMLQACGADGILTVDIHRTTMEGFFKNIPDFHNIQTTRLSLPHILDKQLYNPIVVCPSARGAERAKEYAKLLRCEGCSARMGFMAPVDQGATKKDGVHKHRVYEDVGNYHLVGDCQNSDVIIIDDIIDTSSRVTTCADLCKRMGARRIFVIATHGVFSAGSQKRIDESPIDEVIVANTVQPRHLLINVATPKDFGIRFKSRTNEISRVVPGTRADELGIDPGLRLLYVNDTQTDGPDAESIYLTHPSPFQATIAAEELSTKVKYISVASLLAEAIRRVQNNVSLGIMTHGGSG